MRDANTVLGALLDESGMSRQGLARRINAAGRASGNESHYDHTSVGRWLRGQRPRHPVPDLICDILGDRLNRVLSLADIGMDQSSEETSPVLPIQKFVDRSTAFWRADHLGRPETQSLIMLAGADAIKPVWEWESPESDGDISRAMGELVEPIDVQLLHDARQHFESMYRHVGGLATHTRAAGFLTQHAAPLLYGSYGGGVARDLHRATGGLAAIAGISSYDAGHLGAAQRYFHQALRLAKSSGDRAFGGYVLALMVNQALATGDFRQAVTFAEAALRTAGRSISPALAGDLRAMQAKAFAYLGDVTAARSAIRHAEAAATLIRAEDEPAETSYVQAGHVEGQVTEALITLGDLRPAESYATVALNTEAHPRGRVNRLATSATLALRAGEPDRAAAHALEMVDLSIGMESRRLTDRFAKLRVALAEYPTRITDQALERLDRSLSVLG